MEINTVIYIALALFVALGFSFFQYLYRKNHKAGKDYIFFALRALVVFLVLLLLINPKITSIEYEVEKPELAILLDNSQSVSYLEQEDRIKELNTLLEENKEIRDKFNINKLIFGDKLSLSDSLNFSESQTNIYEALSETENMFSSDQSAVVLLTDGNQSLGRDFRYFKKKPGIEIFPVVVGDTTTYKDLSIERINSNRYAYLKNRFPVEMFLSYTGDEKVAAKLNIKSGDRIIYSENIEFTQDSKSKIVRTDLPANSLGIKTYSVEIEGIPKEKNTLNNRQKFAVEVIDERTSVLILSDISHPDLGAFKKSVESNEQRSVDIKYLDDENLQLPDYQLIVLYQLNRKFNNIVSEILEKKYNYLIVTGTETDWNYLNSLRLGYTRKVTNQPQEIFPVYNPTFASFQFEDIGFEDFPPLLDRFGPIEFENNQYNIMLTQEIQGVKTGEPLMGISQNSPKSGFIFGEDIWRWRAKSYLDAKSFQAFDDFLGKLIQNLSSNKQRQRLTVDSDNFYYGNQNVIITAQYFDENYEFDAGKNLKITVENDESEESFTSDLVLKNNFYEFDAGDLPAGDYSYVLQVDGMNLSKTGKFEVIDYNTEQQFVSANLSGMKAFAMNNETELFYPNQIEDLINNLLKNDKLKPVQKSHEKTVPLVDWYYLLFILIIILAAEWFYRKYLGLI